MSKNTDSQSHKEPATDPMGTWAKWSQEHLDRIQAMQAEMAVWEAKAMDRARDAVQQMADLTQKSLDYVTQLSGAWQTLALETLRRQSEVFPGAK